MKFMKDPLDVYEGVIHALEECPQCRKITVQEYLKTLRPSSDFTYRVMHCGVCNHLNFYKID